MVVYAHRGAFWVGIAAVTLGVTLHLPMYVQAREMDYMMAGMPVDGPMKVGMALILAGLALSVYRLVPRGGPDAGRLARVKVQALDDAPIRRSHVLLLLVRPRRWADRSRCRGGRDRPTQPDRGGAAGRHPGHPGRAGGGPVRRGDPAAAPGGDHRRGTGRGSAPGPGPA
jgi:hypothetical protein